MKHGFSLKSKKSEVRRGFWGLRCSGLVWEASHNRSTAPQTPIIRGYISDPESIDTDYFLEEGGSDVSSEKEELTEGED